MKQKIVNILLLCIAILALLISLLKITPFEVTENTYIGIIITLLSIATTLVIGYQIYNSLELRKEIFEQKMKYDDILSKNSDMEKKYKEQSFQMQEGFDIVSSLIKFNEGQKFITCGNAFYCIHHALISSIETERTDYEWLFQCIRMYISEFEWQTFSSGLSKHNDNQFYIATIGDDCDKTLQEIVDRYLESIRADEKLIRSSSNFSKIVFEYNRIMKLLYKRLDDIVKYPMVELTPEEKRYILGY